MGLFPAKMAPQHFDGIEPGAVGRQVEQDETSGCTSHDRLDFVILVGRGVVPGHIDRPGGMLVQERLQYFGDLTSAFVEPEEDDGFSRVIVHLPNAIVGSVARSKLIC